MHKELFYSHPVHPEENNLETKAASSGVPDIYESDSRTLRPKLQGPRVKSSASYTSASADLRGREQAHRRDTPNRSDGASHHRNTHYSF